LGRSSPEGSREREEAIETALKRYVTDPQVSVFIREYESQRYSVMGAVQNPGTYEMVGRTTILEAISAAGGVDNAESAGRVTVLRPRFEGAPLEIELDQLLEQGNNALNIEIEPGDTINVVPKRRFFIYVYGQVRTPGSFELREDVTLLQAISLAGGLGDRAASNKIRILRRMPDGSQELMEVNLDEIVDGKRADIPIRPNDVIIVPETFF
jgi:polysaccharide export outer membrane protein